MGGVDKYVHLDPVGSRIGAFAEQYMTSDPNASMIKQGMLLEYLIKQYLKGKHLLDRVPSKEGRKYPDLDDMLSFAEINLNKINPILYGYCDEIRKNRNKAAHQFFEDSFAPSDTLPVLESLYKCIMSNLRPATYNRFATNSNLRSSLNGVMMVCEPTPCSFSPIITAEAFEKGFMECKVEALKQNGGFDWITILIEWSRNYGVNEDSISEKARLRQGGKAFSFEEHIKALIYSLMSSQKNWERDIAPKLKQIDRLFEGYNPEFIKSHEGTYFETGIKELKCGSIATGKQMRDLSYNISVLEKIVAKYGSLDVFVTSHPVSEIIYLLSEGEYKLKGVGKALAAEYLRNVGINEVKPDEHLRRFFGNDRMGNGTQIPATEEEVFTTCNEIEEQTGISKTVIDEAIWNFCRASEYQICGKKPNCRVCPISSYCKKGN